MISNIILIGMPGAGKSTIGVVLAKRLGFSFLDTDLVIQEKQKMLLHEILEEYGQDGFNEVENAILSEIFAKNSIKELAQQTQDCFVMTHRSYLVNPQYITAIRRYAITMRDGTELPVPRKKYDEIRRQILSV